MPAQDDQLKSDSEGNPLRALIGPAGEARVCLWRSKTRLHRPLRDLRISVTDRCNFRCVYCMPKEVFGRDYAFLPRDATS